jgi:methyl-accepting chemotaxis protein
MDAQRSDQRGTQRRIPLELGATAFAGACVSGLLGLGLQTLSGSVWAAAAGVVAVAAGLGAWSHRRATREHEALRLVQNAADEAGRHGTIARLDESRLGAVATGFNQLFDSLTDVSQRVVTVIGEVAALPAEINAAMAKVEHSAEAQEEAVEETASLLANINSSMRDINEKIATLQRSADESASSILQMGSSVDEVARNVATLHESVESNTSSLHEMGASIRQVAESTTQVEHAAEETAASMAEMDRVVQEVSSHAREAADLTHEVSEGAERGSRAVEETIADIRQINDRTTAARDTLGKLVSRISEIDEILRVIGEINDETNLLSLNAAIIAAQAGEQGKAFLVVANHVKTLAKRTSASTRDIEKLVQDIQSDSAEAVDAMGAGIAAIDQGVTRSQAAGSALADILERARQARARVEGIAHATEEQSKTSRLVSKAAQETSSQVQQIAAAMTEQTKVSEQMLQNAESSLEVCRHVHRSTDEQRETGRYITSAISSITDMIRQIKESATSHAEASESVSDAVMRLLENAQEAGGQVPAIRRMVEQLSASAEVIIGEVGRFEESNGAGLTRPVPDAEPGEATAEA